MEKIKASWFYILGALCLVLILFAPAIPQDLAYHQFADQRTIFNIPNFHNVWTNFPFILVGLLGMFQVKRMRLQGLTKTLNLSLFTGFLLTGFGSSYYHLHPDNLSLVWDRLPMTIIFISFFSMIYVQVYGEKKGAVFFKMALPAGVVSVAYWFITEYAGAGDLRLYAFVQFFPMLALPVLLVVERRKIENIPLIAWILVLYVIAKVCEHFDRQILEAVSFSGHSIKHLVAAAAMYFMYRYTRSLKLERRIYNLT